MCEMFLKGATVLFGITLARVLIMLAYAVPGFIFIKIKAIKPESISAFAKLLAYVCGPCLAFYSFSRAEYSPQLNKMILIAFAAWILNTSPFRDVNAMGQLYIPSTWDSNAFALRVQSIWPSSLAIMAA